MVLLLVCPPPLRRLKFLRGKKSKIAQANQPKTPTAKAAGRARRPQQRRRSPSTHCCWLGCLALVGDRSYTYTTVIVVLLLCVMNTLHKEKENYSTP